MKKVLCLIALVVLVTASTTSAQEWYEGGTLHTATAQQWNAGSEHDHVATAADWIHVTTDKAIIKQVVADYPEVLHQLSIALAQCVSKTFEGSQVNSKSSDVAVLCLAMFKGQNQNLSWLLSRK